MASLEKRGKAYRIIFRFDGHRFTHGLGTRSEKVALSALDRLEDNLRRAQFGTVSRPLGADPAVFLLSDGAATTARPRSRTSQPAIRTLKQLLDSDLDSMPDGSIEASTRKGLKIHFRHIKRVLGANFLIVSLDIAELQG